MKLGLIQTILLECFSLVLQKVVQDEDHRRVYYWEKIAKNIEKQYVIDSIDEKAGCSVLRLPSYTG